ncbi:hypothetical protein F2P81_022922 [Scophthalmus maximus]|uniref:Uncharacterized protein n=1 Tax=Scophthalmus maximus TaxID=52904 RepID=A0A6A4RXS6_SCOMX|nr:hypothetical protein F2P81_022922 [Scophthalmus maximus]
MLTRNIFLVFSLFILLVEGDLDSNDVGMQATSTDKDSTSDEAPTESMNAISPDQPDEAQSFGGGPADDDSDEGGKKKFGSRSAKPQRPPPPAAHVPPMMPVHVVQSSALLPQPIIPQPKALVRSRASKRRSRTNRRQI